MKSKLETMVDILEIIDPSEAAIVKGTINALTDTLTKGEVVLKMTPAQLMILSCMTGIGLAFFNKDENLRNTSQKKVTALALIIDQDQFVGTGNVLFDADKQMEPVYTKLKDIVAAIQKATVKEHN